jgi:hypothetical protein
MADLDELALASLAPTATVAATAAVAPPAATRLRAVYGMHPSASPIVSTMSVSKAWSMDVHREESRAKRK